MRLIESIINKLTKKIANRDLYYGYIYLNKSASNTKNSRPMSQFGVINFDNFVIMQKLTKSERDSYLKSKFNTFIDSDNAELEKYIAIKNSNIEYFRIPSLNNIVIPQIKYTTEREFIDDDISTLSVYPVFYDLNIPEKYLTVEQIKEYEKQLNKDKKSTYYYTNNEHDNDLREYYEW
ncbi:MAG: hypothetical protein IJA72_01255 [Clostridia bacterium]|nr:hypothetical protein [Clostridia bacterium]